MIRDEVHKPQRRADAFKNVDSHSGALCQQLLGKTMVDFDHPPEDPVAFFNQWMDEAKAKSGLPNPNAMSLATVDPSGKVSSRIVLLKDFDARGAVFYTNRQSRKGLALAANPRCALLFHWDSLDRQVRIEGKVSWVSDSESDAYFASRPRESQIGAWASLQSNVCSDRSELEFAVKRMQQRYEGKSVPRPPHWGGYRISLDLMEFWQGHSFRLHDRVQYTAKTEGGWKVERLYP
ncbi:MAG TPA: pyridoxamine 5'-phosphate oxidase [Phycisphaerales bacterium]|nr:pyridoxamine 5'-phosphate oxidase [Phycisphaerales bacterium]